MRHTFMIAVAAVIGIGGCTDTRSTFDAGTDGGGGRCTGFPTPCSGITDDIDCITAFGCSYDSDCNGVSESCYSQLSMYDCNDQDGCYWSTSTDSCSGVAGSCSLMSGEFTCNGQRGCTWSESCSGVPWECSRHDRNQYDCQTQVGCVWIP